MHAELGWMSDFVEWLGCASGSVDDDGAIAEHSSPEGLADSDALDFRQHDFERPSARETRLNDHAPISDAYFGRIALHNGCDENYETDDNQSTARIEKIPLFLHSAEDCTGDEEQRKHEWPKQNTPVHARPIYKLLA
jgi:hypothetical protein